MDGGIVGLQQTLAGDHGDRRPMLFGDLPGDGLDLQRAHVVGWSVDHVPGQRAGVRHGADGGHIGAPGQQARALIGLLLVAVEPVAPEGEGQGGLVLGDVLGLADDLVGPPGQLGRQGAHRRTPPLTKAVQHLFDAAAGVGDQQDLTGLALELLLRRQPLPLLAQGAEG